MPILFIRLRYLLSYILNLGFEWRSRSYLGRTLFIYYTFFLTRQKFQCSINQQIHSNPARTLERSEISTIVPRFAPFCYATDVMWLYNDIKNISVHTYTYVKKIQIHWYTRVHIIHSLTPLFILMRVKPKTFLSFKIIMCIKRFLLYTSFLIKHYNNERNIFRI